MRLEGRSVVVMEHLGVASGGARTRRRSGNAVLASTTVVLRQGNQRRPMCCTLLTTVRPAQQRLAPTGQPVTDRLLTRGALGRGSELPPAAGGPGAAVVRSPSPVQWDDHDRSPGPLSPRPGARRQRA